MAVARFIVKIPPANHPRRAEVPGLYESSH